jgi:hypothetical protein
MNPAALAAAARGDLKNAIITSTPGGIERQEKEGQIEQSFKDTLPISMQGCSILDFEKLGFKFLGKEDIFWHCEFPKGWRKRPTSHDMWTDLLDAKGRKRGAIFYKAAFYDRSANIHLTNRYGVRNVYLDADQGIPMPSKTRTNAQRVNGVVRTLNFHSEIKGNDHTALRDLLADLRHYCDYTGLDFAKEDKAAYASYLEELRGQR